MIELLKQQIIDALKDCKDADLLDLVYKILLTEAG